LAIRKAVSLTPKSRAHKKKKISSAEGFSILKNWQTHETKLWFVAPKFADFARLSDVVVKSVTPVRLVLADVDSGEETTLDIAGMGFWNLEADEIPFSSDEQLAKFARFLGLRRGEDGPPLLLAEYPSVQ
jgi:hypothetical protein